MTWVAAAVGGGSALLSAGTKYFSGRKQKKKGEALDASTVRTQYTRPGEVTEALNIAERNYLNGMPGSDVQESRIGTSSATALDTATQGATSSADVLDAATKINLNTNNALLDLGVQEQRHKEGAMQNYIGQLMNNAQYADKEFSYNIDQPYQENKAKAAAMIGAGAMNMNAGVNEALGAVSTIAPTIAGAVQTPATRGEMKNAIQPIENVSPITTANLKTGNKPAFSGISPLTGETIVWDPATNTMRKI